MGLQQAILTTVKPLILAAPVSLRCSLSIACRRCSNYIFILHPTIGFNILRKTIASRDEKHLSLGV